MRANKKSLVLMSGGIDSFACAHFLLKQEFEVHALFLSYGQAALNSEWAAVRTSASYLNISIERVNISGFQDFKDGEIVGRNLLLISTALMFASSKFQTIALGVHSGTNYIDCSKSFIGKTRSIVEDSSAGKTTLLTPFLGWQKNDILHYCEENSLPLDITYSCEKQDSPECGECLSCLDRKMLKC